MGANNEVTIPYLQSWNMTQNNLKDLLSFLSSVMKADPPKLTAMHAGMAYSQANANFDMSKLSVNDSQANSNIFDPSKAFGGGPNTMPQQPNQQHAMPQASPYGANQPSKPEGIFNPTQNPMVTPPTEFAGSA